jgi:hypothetical protein
MFLCEGVGFGMFTVLYVESRGPEEEEKKVKLFL